MNKKFYIVISALFLMFHLSAIASQAAPGDLDFTFDGDGKVTTQIGAYTIGNAVAIQADGKIVVVGDSGGDFMVVRYNTDGSLDLSFDGDGIVITPVAAGTDADTATSIAIQADGKLVVAGYLQYTTQDGKFAVVRYLGDLAPTAASVSVGGRVLTSNGRGISKARVSITNMDGETQTVLTNPFGFFRFNEIPAGGTYIISVAHKRYQFTDNPRILTILEQISELDFTAEPRF